MSPIKDLQMIYKVLNEEDTFSAGDTVEGAVTFTLKKETKVKSVLVKMKGEARVQWSEGSGDDRKTYSDSRRYFKVKEYLVAQNAKGTVLPCGVHHFNFKLKIPQGDMPSSMKGVYGEIVYLLEAKLSRSWRWPTGVQRELNFMSKSSSLHHGQVMCPQSGSVDEKVGVFSKGQVQLSATADRKVCSPGDTVSVVAKISNSSSKTMRPKFSLRQEIKYHASSSTNTNAQSLCKMVGDVIKDNSEETVSCQMKIPLDVTPTLHNCEIISVDYCLKVYLDISFATDPEVRFPLVIIPRFAILQSGDAVGPYPAGAGGAPSYSDFPPSALPVVPPAPGACGYPAPDPNQLVNTSGYSNQWPQQATPYSFSAAAFPPSSGQHQAPNAPPSFQQGEPPAYTSLYPPSYGTWSSTGSIEEK